FTASSLRTYLRERLPSPMVPTFIVFLEALPLTPNGKVDRMALPVVDRAQLHQDETQISSPSGAGLQTVLHELLGQIWKDVLTLPQVGIHDNFFELGGHSLLATQVVARMRRVLDVDVPLRSLFEAPTIAQLSQHLEDLMRSASTGSAQGTIPTVMERPGDLPLSFAQERLWFLDQ